MFFSASPFCHQVLNSCFKLFSGIFLGYFPYYPVSTILRDLLGFMLNHWLTTGDLLINVIILHSFPGVLWIFDSQHVNSTSDDSCHTHLIETIETLPMDNSVERIVSKVLGSCRKVSRATENPDIKGTCNTTFKSFLK